MERVYSVAHFNPLFSARLGDILFPLRIRPAARAWGGRGAYPNPRAHARGQNIPASARPAIKKTRLRIVWIAFRVVHFCETIRTLSRYIGTELHRRAETGIFNRNRSIYHHEHRTAELRLIPVSCRWCSLLFFSINWQINCVWANSSSNRSILA